MVAEFKVLSAAGADLQGIRQRSPPAAAALGVLLFEARHRPELLEHLAEAGEVEWAGRRVSVAPWGRQQAAGRNLWRLKIIEYGAPQARYRIIYCIETREDALRRPLTTYYVLGIIARNEFSYDNPKDPFTQRILADCERLGIGRA